MKEYGCYALISRLVSYRVRCVINASIALKVVFSSYVSRPLNEEFLVFQILKHTATTHKSANVFCSNVIG